MAADLSPRTRAAEPAGPRLRRASAALLGVMLTLAGCGGPPAADPSPPVPSATDSAPDTTVSGIDALFLAMMVAHTE
ncbi:hypothetical protein AB0F90_31420 [Micromonospora chalcea]|uniref:hypothetical protein n=1 Tax=Micromonospora chalcea TaxID=1874 RepID=UPI0033F814FD